jgi:hypothetical protein
MYAVEMASCGMTHLPSFMKIGTWIQAILRCSVRNLRGCDVGITNGKGSRSVPLRWVIVALHTYQVSLKLV